MGHCVIGKNPFQACCHVLCLTSNTLLAKKHSVQIVLFCFGAILKISTASVFGLDFCFRLAGWDVAINHVLLLIIYIAIKLIWVICVCVCVFVWDRERQTLLKLDLGSISWLDMKWHYLNLTAVIWRWITQDTLMVRPFLCQSFLYNNILFKTPETNLRTVSLPEARYRRIWKAQQRNIASTKKQ